MSTDAELEAWGAKQRTKADDYWALVAGLYDAMGSAKFFSALDRGRGEWLTEAARTVGIKATAEGALQWDGLRAQVRAAETIVNGRWTLDRHREAKAAAKRLATAKGIEAWEAEHEASAQAADAIAAYNQAVAYAAANKTAQFWATFQNGRYWYIGIPTRRRQ